MYHAFLFLVVEQAFVDFRVTDQMITGSSWSRTLSASLLMWIYDVERKTIDESQTQAAANFKLMRRVLVKRT